MHHLHFVPILTSLLLRCQVHARPVGESDESLCETTVILPSATLIVSPGPSDAIVKGLPGDATSTLKVDGPAITIGPSVLLLNKEHDLNLDGQIYLFAGVCPALLIPVTTPTAVVGGEPVPSSSSTMLVPIGPGPTDTPRNDNSDDNPSVPVIPVPVPNTPNTPVEPGYPNDPSRPNDPNKPNDPNNPSNPNPDPNKPVGPTDPDLPNSPDKPEVPGLPPVPGSPPGPNVPVVTPPPPGPGIVPTKPDGDKPKECETESASICTQACSFGVNDKGTTTTTSCATPSCTITAGCTVTASTSTTTIEPKACPLSDGNENDFPLEIGGDGPLPILRNPVAGAPAPADPQPTPSLAPPADTKPEPSQAPESDQKPAPGPPSVYEVGGYTDVQGIKYSAIFQRDGNGKINICDDSPFYAGQNLLGTFDLPQSYSSCTFVGIGGKGPEDWGIFCKDKERIPCVQKQGSSASNCLGDPKLAFEPLWACGE
jgi:hypothetical protein